MEGKVAPVVAKAAPAEGKVAPAEGKVAPAEGMPRLAEGRHDRDGYRLPGWDPSVSLPDAVTEKRQANLCSQLLTSYARLVLCCVLSFLMYVKVDRQYKLSTATFPLFPFAKLQDFGSKSISKWQMAWSEDEWLGRCFVG